MFHGNESIDSEKALEFNKFVDFVFHDSSFYTVPDQLNGPAISLINLDFFLSDFILLLESCDVSSAAGGDEFLLFLLDHCSNVLILVMLVLVSYSHFSLTIVRTTKIRWLMWQPIDYIIIIVLP